MKLVLPWPPSLNGYKKPIISTTKKGRKYPSLCLTEAANQYRDDVFWLVKAAKVRKALTGRLSVEIVLHEPNSSANRRRDIDNYQKVLFDALTAAGVWVDDHQIDRMLVERGSIDPDKLGFIIVTITEIEAQQQF